jgi:hypothetical protein
METEISLLNLVGLEIRLTSDKLYIKTPASQETFALRSLNGIGVIDLVEEYNRDLVEYNKKKSEANKAKFLIGCSAAIAVFSYFTLGEFGVIMAVAGLAGGVMLLRKVGKIEMPFLKSAVRIMMSGNSRDFSFDPVSHQQT